MRVGRAPRSSCLAVRPTSRFSAQVAVGQTQLREVDGRRRNFRLQEHVAGLAWSGEVLATRLSGEAMFMCGNLELRVAGDRHRVAIRSFLERLSQSTAYARYLGPVSTTDTFWSERELNRLLDGNDSGHVVVLAVEATDAIR